MSKGRPEPTAIYDARALALSGYSLEVLHSYIDRLPRAPLDKHLNDANSVRYMLCLFVIGAVRATRETCSAFQLSWFSGHFLSASTMVRMLIELWGSALYAEEKVLRTVEKGEPITANQKMVKLFFGSKAGVKLHAAIPIKEPPVNVMEFVRAAERSVVGMLANYEFLCDAAHPSYLQNSYLLFAGATCNNWSNEIFAEEMHVTLDRTLNIAAAALDGIEKAVVDIFERCLPPILQDYASDGGTSRNEETWP